MAVQTLHDKNISISPEMDGGVYASALSDGIVKGIGDNFALTWSKTSLNLTFKAGSMAVIGGSFFKVTTNTTLTLDSSNGTTQYIFARIDKNKSDGSKGYFVATASSSPQTGNLNDSGTQRDLLLYSVTLNSTGVQSYTDRRTYAGVNTGKITIKCGDQTVVFPSGTESTITIPTPKIGINSKNRLVHYVEEDTSGRPRSYTATQDVIVIIRECIKGDNSNYGGINIDGTRLWGDKGSYARPQYIYLSSGQTIEFFGPNVSDRVRYDVYSLK